MSVWGGPSAIVVWSAKVGVVVFKASVLNSLGGSIGQSRFICQVQCSSIQGIYSQFTGGPSARVGSSAKFGVAVFMVSILDSLGGSLAKVGSSANLGGLVFKASLLYTWGIHLPKYVHLPGFVYQYSRHLCCISQGGPSAKVGSSAKFGVAVFKASILDSPGGSICQNMFIC